ncbi:hypothetical protein GCM10007235_33290 [Pseudoxanthomonas indica]|nr:hypothetical protein GCM10007235_33290 [Pseudoxanthomonas indica]
MLHGACDVPRETYMLWVTEAYKAVQPNIWWFSVDTPHARWHNCAPGRESVGETDLTDDLLRTTRLARRSEKPATYRPGGNLTRLGARARDGQNKGSAELQSRRGSAI